jgi:hypothetical protein
MREYIVTLYSRDDLDGFYEDMETEGGSITIPGRKVHCCCRRNISRNTHYMLTDEEALEVANDPRVLACELLPSERGIGVIPFWEQSGNFEKNATIDSNDKNWGLYRCINTNPLTNWGTNGTFTQTTQTVSTTSSGKNVDVIIVDSHINPNHPEFAVNPDGTGGSRVNQFNWFQYSTALGHSTDGTYNYNTVTSNHGTHVAGTACGNTQGWARDCNIYNMEFNDSAGSNGISNWSIFLFDYLRYFHLNKPINPETGRRNPTVTNHSWGYSYNGDTFNGAGQSLSLITQITYRGTSSSVTGNNTQKKVYLEARSIPVPGTTFLFKVPARVPAVDADLVDAINDGVIIISSAGNSYWNVNIASGADYNNSYTYNSNTIIPMQGSTPGAADGCICVGSIGTKTQEYKSDFSNFGERVDIWAPGSNIISSVYNSTAASEFGITLADDPRNSTYKLGSISGTSMSGPQVAGIIACLAEQEPRLSQTDALNYLIEVSKTQVGDTGGTTTTDFESFGDSNNRFSFYRKERPETGVLSPKINYKRRRSSSVRYPRPNSSVFKRS